MISKNFINYFYFRENTKKLKQKNHSLSLIKLKDIRHLYKPYIPKIYKIDHNNKNNNKIVKKDLKYNLSEETIFGNLNYSFNVNIFFKNPNNSSTNKTKKFLIPITKYKSIK